jgi:hypothetical protein
MYTLMPCGIAVAIVDSVRCYEETFFKIRSATGGLSAWLNRD